MANKSKIVVTGIGVVSPIGIAKEEFWAGLRQGISGVRPISLFDPGFFKARLAGEVINFSPEKYFDAKVLRILDRSTRFLCVASKLALDDAGLVITQNNCDEVGVVTATTLSAMWNIAEFSKEAVDEGPQFVNPASFPGTTINAPSSQVSIRFGIKGFNTTVSTGYTASLDALRYAVDFIRAGKVKAALVTGVESLSFQNFVGFYKIGFLAGIRGEEVSCPFDLRRNGIILGEGSAALIIEDHEYARQRNARIYAYLYSVESMFDAYRSSKYQPQAEGLKRTMAQAVKSAGLLPKDISYISASANSVPQQDKLETYAIKSVFRRKAFSIPVSSIKSMIGESVSASGVLQLTGSIGALVQGFIPPTINYEKFDPECNLDYVVNKSKQKELRHILINNFGPGGNNASTVISKYEE